MKQIFLLLLGLHIFVMLEAETLPAANFAGGSGTNDDPYQIETLAQLRLLSDSSKYWSESFVLIANIDASDTKNWNSGKGFSPIGNDSKKFTGTFNGDFYYINGLFIENNNDYAGLFGYTDKATIKQLGLTDCILSAGGYTGSLIGEADNSIIEKCYVSGSIKGAGRSGGLIGGVNNSKVKQCYTNCSIVGSYFVGGIVGYIYSTGAIVENCFSYGKTEATTYRYGGIAGYFHSGTVRNCYVAGEVPTGTDAGVVFGILGSAGMITISNCYYDVTVNPSLGAANGASHENITALSTSDFSGASNFGQFDFTDLWTVSTISYFDENARPYFQWMYDYYVVTFNLGINGDNIEGSYKQYIFKGTDALSVTAVGIDGYILKEWQNTNGDYISSENPLTVTNVSQDSTFYAVFQPGYKVKFYSGNNGIISSGDVYQEVMSGNDASGVTASANTGYIFDEWRNAAGDSITNINPLTITNVKQDSTLYALYQIGYKIQFSAAENGEVTGTTYQELIPGNTTTSILASANTGYHFDEWRNAAGDSITNDNPFIITNVSQDSTLIAVFEMNTYSVKFTTDNHGTIEENAEQTVNYGANAAEVEAVPNIGYRFVKWQDENGNEVSTSNPFTLTNVTRDLTITAVFEIEHYSVKFTTGGNGTIKGSAEQTVDHGASATEVEAIANDGYKFVKWQDSKGNAVSTDNPFTLTNVTHDSTITAVFKKTSSSTSYTVKFETDGNGTIKGNAEQTIESGASATEVEAIANDGYKFVKWQDKNGNEVSTDNPFTLTNVTHDSTITAVFKKTSSSTSYTVKFETDGNGTIKGNAEQTVDHGSSATEVEAIANTGYQFEKWQDENGNKVSTDNPFVLKNVISDTTVYAVFEVTTGIDDIDNTSDITIYPNPTTGVVNVLLENTRDKASICVYTITGELVYSDTLLTGNPLDLSGLKDGIYFIKVISEGKESITKLIKE